MITKMRGFCGFFPLLLLSVALAPVGRCQATPGVTDKEILIGSCSALEGPSKFLGSETVTGAKAYFDTVNEAGGVDGRKLRLITADDSYDPAKTQACFDKMLSENVFALGFFVGTPTAVKYLPMAESNKIPLVGLFTGAQTLYQPLRHWVINVRASYFDETREQIDGLWDTLKYRKIGVIYPDDSFGAAVLEGVTAALKAHGAEPIAIASYARQTTQVGSGDRQRAGREAGRRGGGGPFEYGGTDHKAGACEGLEAAVFHGVVCGYGRIDQRSRGRRGRHGDYAGGAAVLLDGLQGGDAVPAALQKYYPTMQANFVSFEGLSTPW